MKEPSNSVCGLLCFLTHYISERHRHVEATTYITVTENLALWSNGSPEWHNANDMQCRLHNQS